MKKNFFTIAFCLINLNILAQNITISGYVKDAVSTENLINATVRIQGTNNAVFTNEYGYYTLNIKQTDTITISASYLGYMTENKIVIAVDNKNINFNLIENNSIDSIVISAVKTIDKTKEIGTHTLYLNQLKMLPSLGGEKDILKAIQMLPGIQSGNEGSNGIFVRGGGIDENLILLDDVPLYNVNHLGGFVSVFNPDAINSVKIIKGGFPAKYGGRLSSIVDVRMLEGNQNKLTGNFSISPITSNFSINGPLKKQKTTFMLSARAFYLGAFMRTFTFLSLEGYSIGYNFYDVNSKISHSFNEKNKIFISFYKGNDRAIMKLNDFMYSNNSDAEIKTNWGNTLVAFKWYKILTSKLFLNTTIAHTKYYYQNIIDYQNKEDTTIFKVYLNTSVKDFLLKSDLQYSVSNNFKINFGFNTKFLIFQPLYLHILYKNDKYNIDTSYKNNEITAIDNSIYFESEFSLLKIFSFNLGFRVTDYFADYKHFYFIEPRLIFIINTSHNSAIKSSYAETQQNIHLITSSSLSMPMDIWAASNQDLPPSFSKQFSSGFYSNFLNQKFEFSIEAYFKTSNNLVSFKEGATYLSVIGDWTDKLETNGYGKSYGIELLLEKKQGKTIGWISYTLSKTTRKFENINFGNEFLFKYDRRHNLNIVVTHKYSKKINFSACWIYGTGYPYTLPVARYDIDDEIYNDTWLSSDQIVVFANQNEYRMRDYHRLDFAINFIKERKKSTGIWSISIYNVYNRKNAYSYFLKKNNGQWNIYQQSLFPIIPSISYSLKF